MDRYLEDIGNHYRKIWMTHRGESILSRIATENSRKKNTRRIL